jgi:hypothetical protein
MTVIDWDNIVTGKVDIVCASDLEEDLFVLTDNDVKSLLVVLNRLVEDHERFTD